jgi:KDO2-lipid IV(A) lauroyltransferase
MKINHYLSYLLIRAFLFPFSLLPYSWIHCIGRKLGYFLFPWLTKYRKMALSNLALASELDLSVSEIENLAKESLGNLLITGLEYGKLARDKNIHKTVFCTNPEEANKILQTGQGIIFFCAHQANWEVLFLDGTSRMPGVAIGQPIANKYLYHWIQCMRQKFGGLMIDPKQSVKEGLRALKRGSFLGIVGDQALPEGGFSSPFLGRPAFTSPLPAILSHKTGAPIIVATTVRKQGSYYIEYSAPFWPDEKKSMDEDIQRLMIAILQVLQETIKQHPEQWLWQHNKWKHQGHKTFEGKQKKRYRMDCLAVFFPQDPDEWDLWPSFLQTLRELYPTELLSLYVPVGMPISDSFPATIIRYTRKDELKIKDYRYKLVFNFTHDKSLTRHFLRLAAFEVLTLKKIAHLSGIPKESISSQLRKVILHAR